MLIRLTLPEIQARAWDLLGAAPQDRESALRLATLATVDDAGQPRARTVVLRSCEVGYLEVYSDARSPKIAELRAQSRAALCFYDPQRQLQLRLEGDVRVHLGDPRSAEAWREAGIYARRDYLGPSAPGTPLDDPSLGDPAPDLALNDAEPEQPGCDQSGGGNLAVLRLEVQRLDWLVLDRAGHRRAEFLREGAGWSARWLMP